MTEDAPPSSLPGAGSEPVPPAQVLNDRYELHRLIGRGGMAEVFLARDRTLDRPVAVKVLFPEFSTDPSFVERFRREAQSAANLTHPNVVGVYDWGTQGSTYYIVMEYVEGRTLSEIIRSEGPLHPTRAAEVAAEIAAALGFAAQRGVVHRDIKPGNVIVATNGAAKVADFGIARALASNDDELTKAGSVMGTATYFSPEQAQGLRVDPRSDLYSLGVVLYESVVGRPPFQGESPVTIAYKHVQEAPVPPSRVVPSIPPALDAITMKLLAKNPDNRYASAEELRADLKRFVAGEPVKAEGVMAPAPIAAAAAAATTVVPATAAYVEDDYEEPPRRTGVFLTVLVLLLALLAGGLFWLAQSLGGDSELVTVPDVVNQSEEDARRILTDAGFQVSVREEPSDTVEAGTVISQDPGANTEAEADSVVEIVVSAGTGLIEVPNVVDLDIAEAERRLTEAGFQVQRSPVEAEDEDDVDKVLSQSPVALTEVPEGSLVVLEVGTERTTAQVPGVIGSNEQSAIAAIEGEDLIVRVEEEELDPDDERIGEVIAQDPAAGTQVEVGSQVTITVGVEGEATTTTTSAPSTTTTTTTTTTSTTTTTTTAAGGGGDV